MNPVYHVAICGLDDFGRTIGNYAWVTLTDRLESQKVFDLYTDSLRFRGWEEQSVDDSDEVAGDYILKFEKDGYIRYVVRWKDVKVERDAQLLRNIAFHLVGMQFSDLTTAEQNIVKSLITFSYLKINDDGELEFGDPG